MDLSLIRERIMSGALMSLDDMSRDLFVMCNNAMVFNGKGDPYFDYSKVQYTVRMHESSPPPLPPPSCGSFSWARAVCSSCALFAGSFPAGIQRQRVCCGLSSSSTRKRTRSTLVFLTLFGHARVIVLPE